MFDLPQYPYRDAEPTTFLDTEGHDPSAAASIDPDQGVGALSASDTALSPDGPDRLHPELTSDIDPGSDNPYILRVDSTGDRQYLYIAILILAALIVLTGVVMVTSWRPGHPQSHHMRIQARIPNHRARPATPQRATQSRKHSESRLHSSRPVRRVHSFVTVPSATVCADSCGESQSVPERARSAPAPRETDSGQEHEGAEFGFEE